MRPGFFVRVTGEKRVGLRRYFNASIICGGEIVGRMQFQSWRNAEGGTSRKTQCTLDNIAHLHAGLQAGVRAAGYRAEKEGMKGAQLQRELNTAFAVHRERLKVSGHRHR